MPRQERQTAHKESLRNTLFSVELIHDCLVAKRDFLQVTWEQMVTGLLETFQADVGDTPNKHTATHEWLEDASHRAALENILAHTAALAERASPSVPSTKATSERFRAWLDLLVQSAHPTTTTTKASKLLDELTQFMNS